MLDPIRFVIPGPPQRKERPRFAKKTGRAYTPAATRKAENRIAELCKSAMEKIGMTNPFTGPVRVNIEAVFEAPKSWPKYLRERTVRGTVWHCTNGDPDLDNITKLCDGLNGTAFADDCQVAVLTAGKRFGSPARVEVQIIPLSQDEAEITPGQRRLEADMASGEWHLKRAARGF